MRLLIISLLMGLNAFGSYREYIECRSVRPVLDTGSGKKQYAELRIEPGLEEARITYHGPIYTLKNIPGGFVKNLPQESGFSNNLKSDALLYSFVNTSAAQEFELAIQNPEDAPYPEEHLRGFLSLSDGKPIGFSTQLHCNLVIPLN